MRARHLTYGLTCTYPGFVYADCLTYPDIAGGQRALSREKWLSERTRAP
jgi:hypothetical protein